MKSRTLTLSEARSHCRGQFRRPAHQRRLTIADLRFLLRRTPGATSKSQQVKSTLRMSWSLEVIHVPKGGLSYVGNLEAREDSLQPDQKGFQVDD
jgi:hypothetical protein